MDGEMYVVNMIRASERARAVAAQFLGDPTEIGQLMALRDADFLPQLTRTLNCPEIDAFTELGRAIGAAFKQRALPIFTRNHLQRLSVPESKGALAKVLNCRFNDVIATLFDPVAMKETLQQINSEKAGKIELDAELLLYTILNQQIVAAVEQQLFGLGSNGWGVILQEEGWLRSEAVASLKNHATKQGWHNKEVTRVLAAIVDEPGASRPRSISEDHTLLDALALTYLRQRLQWAITLLSQEAFNRAKEAAQLAPSQPEIVNLYPWLEMYERGAVARALSHFFAHKKALSTFPGNHKIPPWNGSPDPKKELLISDEETYKRGVIKRREYGSFVVSCVPRDGGEPHVILHCRNVPIEYYNLLRPAIQKLTGADLSPHGKTVGERLLNTPVLAQDRMLQLLSAGLEDLGLSFVQCLILCGTPLPIEMDVPWYDDLTEELPYAKLSANEDIAFPYDIRAIVEDLSLQYRQAGRRVEVVTGVEEVSN